MKPKSRNLIVGIDPGISGAVAAIDSTGIVISIEDTPSIKVKRGNKYRNLYAAPSMADIFARLKVDWDIRIVAIESVHAMPGQGVTSMFSMGTGFGIWLGILAAFHLPYDLVEPRVWKKAMGIPTGSEKAASVPRATQLFPEACGDLARKKDHGRADALLLAEYVRRFKLSTPATPTTSRLPRRRVTDVG